MPRFLALRIVDQVPERISSSKPAGAAMRTSLSSTMSWFRSSGGFGAIRVARPRRSRGSPQPARSGRGARRCDL
jgi:hypothetical protein